MATEIELKLYCSPDEIDRVVTHPLIAAGVESGLPKYLENTYYDTPDLALHEARIALRVRTTPTEQLQTVKCAAKSVAGLSVRPEWEVPYGGAFNFEAVEAEHVRAFLETRQPSLEPVFTTSFERRTWRIEVSRKTALWVMIDVGRVTSGEDRFLPISEVELELAQGDPEDLLDFAAALAADLPLIPHDISKAERGYQLYLRQPSRAQKALPSPLSGKHRSGEAFRLLAEQGVQMWQANLFGLLTEEGQEFVHQFRVSLRRLNSLFKVFKPVLPRRYQTQWTKRVKALSQITGDVRDLDVMRACIIEPLQQSTDRRLLGHAEVLLGALDAAKQEALAQLQQLRYGGPILRFARDLQDLDADDFPKNLSRFAERQIADLHRCALKRLAKALKTPTPEKAHRFRIALKHLRYACEFFAPLFDNDEMVEYAKAIAGLQDAFGFINDFHVAQARLQDWVAREVIRKEARAAVVAWHAPQVKAVLADALQLAEAVMSRCQPWCTECERRGIGSSRRRIQQTSKT